MQHGQPGGQIFASLGFNGGKVLKVSHYVQATNAGQRGLTHHLFPGSLPGFVHDAVHSTRHHLINQGRHLMVPEHPQRVFDPPGGNVPSTLGKIGLIGPSVIAQSER